MLHQSGASTIQNSCSAPVRGCTSACASMPKMRVSSTRRLPRRCQASATGRVLRRADDFAELLVRRRQARFGDGGLLFDEARKDVAHAPFLVGGHVAVEIA